MWSYTKLGVFVCVWSFISVTSEAPGGWAGHSWPQGSPDYVYDGRTIIRAGQEGHTIHTQHTHIHTHKGWPKVDAETTF